MARPIFIIGNNRSGTHWLSNILLNHPGIAGIQHENHDGIVETEILTAMPRIFGPLAKLSSRIGFTECFAATDFFRLSGLTLEDLYSFPVDTYPGFLRAFLDRVADRRGRPCWLQKFSPLVLPDLIRQFPDGRFIMILRDVIPTVRSSMKRWGQGWWPRDVLTHLYRYYFGMGKILVHRRHPSVFMVHYEQLKDDTEGTIRKICRFLGMEFHPQMVNVAYNPNTSFKDSQKGQAFLTPGQLRWITLGSWFFRCIPLSVFSLWNWGRGRLAPRRQAFNSRTFSLLRDERNLPPVEPPAPPGDPGRETI
jgi:hypothetical protein